MRIRLSPGLSYTRSRTVPVDNRNISVYAGEHPFHSPLRGPGCCLPVGQTRRHSPTHFSGLYTFKVGITRYPCTSPAFVPTASTRLLPGPQQGSILRWWLANTQVGFQPTRVRGIAKSQLPPLVPRVRLARGFGTKAASRAMKSSGSKMTCVVPLR